MLSSNFDTCPCQPVSFWRSRARVAQWIERLPPEQEAAGSNPAAGIINTRGPLLKRPFPSGFELKRRHARRLIERVAQGR